MARQEFKQPSFRRDSDEYDDPIRFSQGGSHFGPSNSTSNGIVNDIDNVLAENERLASSGWNNNGAPQSVAQAERNTQAPEKRLGDTTAGKIASTAAAPTGFVGKSAVKLLGKINIKKGGIGTAIVGLLIAAVIFFTTFLGPGLLVVQVKEVLADKFNSTLAAMDARTTAIIKKKMGVTNGICREGVKVLCRFDGFSKKQIKALERADVKINSKGTTTFGKTKVDKLIMPDGTEVTAQNLSSVLSENPEVRGILGRAFNPRYVVYSDKVFAKISAKLDLSKQKRLTGATDEELEKNLKNSVAGVDENGERIGRSAVTQGEDGKFRDQFGNEISAEEAERIRAGNLELEKSISSIKESGKKAGFKMGKSVALGALVPGAGSIDTLCTGYYLIQTVGYGAKVLAAQQLIRYSFVFMNTADAIKAGDATAAEVSYLGKIMTDKNEFNQSFTDSFLYKYADHSSLAMPTGKDTAETEDMRASITQYALGGGIGGALLTFNQQLNTATGGSVKEVCSTVKKTSVQITMFAVGIIAAIGTGGATLGAGAVTSAAASAGIGVVLAFAIPKLQNMAAQTLVTPSTKGGDAGNAAVAGFGALNSQNSMARGLSPLTQSNVLRYQNRTARVAKEYHQAELAVSDKNDLYTQGTTLNTVATRLATALQSPKDTLQNPINILQFGVSSLFSKTAFAAAGEETIDQYSLCDDQEYKDMNYAADPACNLRFGFSENEMDVDPETVTEWMYDNGHITDDGEPKSSDYQSYIENCIDRVNPFGSTGEEGQDDDGSRCSKQGMPESYYRVYYFDDTVTDALDEEETAPDPTIPITTGSGSLPSGNDRDLARQILSSGKVTGSDKYMSQIRAYANGDYSCHINPTILQLLAAMAQKHTIYITSLNRFCTKVLTDSGARSYHWREGGGHAVDIGIVDGVRSTGGTSKDISLIKEYVPELPSGSGLGQQQCRAERLTFPNDIIQFADTCNHVHIQVPVR